MQIAIGLWWESRHNVFLGSYLVDFSEEALLEHGVLVGSLFLKGNLGLSASGWFLNRCRGGTGRGNDGLLCSLLHALLELVL